MEGDEWVVHDFVLETTQVVIKGDDVLFEGDAASQGDPALVSLNARAGDREPFVQFLWLTDERPHFVGTAVNEVAAADRTHVSKLTVSLDENGTKQESSVQQLVVLQNKRQ